MKFSQFEEKDHKIQDGSLSNLFLICMPLHGNEIEGQLWFSFPNVCIIRSAISYL